MTIIANPIYDAVFKFLMEDKKVAKIFLSALLKKDIIDLEMRRHEYTSMEHTRISLFRIDFSAKIRENDAQLWNRFKFIHFCTSLLHFKL